MLDSFIVRSLTAFSIIYLILVSISSLTGLKVIAHRNKESVLTT